MNLTRKLVAWLCLLSILLMGCSGSKLVKPEGDTKEMLAKGEITYVVTKTGKKYEFEKPPTLVGDTIVGEAKLRVTEGMMRLQAAIPLSDVDQVSVKEEGRSWGTTAIILGGIVALVLLIILASEAPGVYGWGG